MEQQIWVLLHSILNSDDYDGGIILTDSETRTELAESEITKIKSGAEAIKRPLLLLCSRGFAVINAAK